MDRAETQRQVRWRASIIYERSTVSSTQDGGSQTNCASARGRLLNHALAFACGFARRQLATRLLSRCVDDKDSRWLEPSCPGGEPGGEPTTHTSSLADDICRGSPTAWISGERSRCNL